MSAEPNYKPRTWIRAALCAGGSLEMRAVFPGKSIFQAVMRWPGETDVSGTISTSIGGAIDELETKLCDDAAEEMLSKGHV